ncbi:MAG: radical SAM protein [Selenomonadaceae bacterium]|nr:radical SAM protein [Selenomonadaceae bacterium]
MSDIRALYATEDGEIFDAPNILPMGRIGDKNVLLKEEDLIPLPDGADLMFLPGRKAVGMMEDGEVVPILGYAVAALLPQGFTRLYLPAYEKDEDSPLPIYGYTAAVLVNDEIFVAAMKTDESESWNPLNYNTPELKKLIKRVKADLPQNSIVENLQKCALKWHCLTAENLFYRRFEAGVPVSPVCNANCLGCISLQTSQMCPAPQSRIKKSPAVKEIVEVMLYHLDFAPNAMVSFGQGCEGDPSLAADIVATAIERVRERTKRGKINMNTNGGFTKGVKQIVDAGLNNMRLSIISPTEEIYGAYYRANYSLNDVKTSIKYAMEKGVYVSLNLLTFPGLNDREEEVTAWIDFFKELPVPMIQIRNLNMDPDFLLDKLPRPKGKMLGTRRFLEILKENFPDMIIGSFSHS